MVKKHTRFCAVLLLVQLLCSSAAVQGDNQTKTCRYEKGGVKVNISDFVDCTCCNTSTCRMCSSKGMNSGVGFALISVYTLVFLILGGATFASFHQTKVGVLLEEPHALALEFKPRKRKGTVETTTEHHSGPQTILVSFLADGTFAMSFQSKNGTVIAEHDSDKGMCDSDIGSVLQNSWSLELKPNEYITSIVQENRDKPNPDTPVYVGIKITTNLREGNGDAGDTTFQNRERDESDKLLNSTVFSCPPGFMISSFECKGNQIIKAVAMPVVIVYHTTVELGGTGTKNYCRSKKFVLTTLVEVAVIVLDLISLYTLYSAFGGETRGSLGLLRTGQIRPIHDCILEWNDVVKPCLSQGRSDCLKARLKQGTEITFGAFADSEGDTEAGRCYTSSGSEISCSACMRGGNKTQECFVKDVVLMYPYKTLTSKESKASEILPTWNISSDHEYCVADATPYNTDDAFSMLTLWKLLHVSMEIGLLVYEIIAQRGATHGISSLHLENVKTSKLKTLIKAGWRSALGFFVSTPANYMYASLLTVGAPITASSVVGVETFKGPGMWAAGSTVFITASSYTVWLFMAVLVIIVGALTFSANCGQLICLCLGKSATRKFYARKTQLDILRLHNNLQSHMLLIAAKWCAVLVLSPLMFFFVIALYDSFSGSAITLASLFSSFDLKLNVNLSVASFDVVGAAVLTASSTFIAAMGRYIVMMLHVRPKSVSQFCQCIGRILSRQKVKIAKNTKKVVELAEVKGAGVPEKVPKDLPSVLPQSNAGYKVSDNKGKGMDLNASDLEAATDNLLEGPSFGQKNGNVIVHDKASELRDTYLKRFDSKAENTEDLKGKATEEIMSKCCASPVYFVALTPPKIYHQGRSTALFNSPNGIIALRIPDEIWSLMRNGKRALMRVKLIKDKVKEVRQIPDVEMVLKGAEGEICYYFGGPDNIKDKGSGNNVKKIEHVFMPTANK